MGEVKLTLTTDDLQAIAKALYIGMEAMEERGDSQDIAHAIAMELALDNIKKEYRISNLGNII